MLPLLGDCARVAFVGLAKNSGKTEAARALLRECRMERRPVGLTSIGHDGEAFDSLRPGLRKSRIRLYEGDLVTTTEEFLEQSDAETTVLGRIAERTALGSVVIARVHSPGFIEVAGPSSAEGVCEAGSRMLDLGASLAVVDGALDRRIAAAPHVADAVVMATGAVLDRDLKRVCELSRAAYDLLSLDILPAGQLRLLMEEGDALAVSALGTIHSVPPGMLLSTDQAQIGSFLQSVPGPRHVRVAGALSQVALEAALTQGATTFVVRDPTRVFVGDRPYQRYRERGVEVRVLERSPVRLVTVNPAAPSRRGFRSETLRQAVADELPSVPVIDVRHPRAASRATQTA